MNTKTLDFLNIPVGQFPDRSMRRLLAEPENVRGLMQIVADHLVEHLDFSQLIQVNTTFIPDNLRQQEADIVCSVPYRRGEETEDLLIYILIEHQSTVDISMGFRLLFYMMHIWDSDRRDWHSKELPMREWRLRPIIPIVLYTGEREWRIPLTLTALMGDVPDLLARFVPSFDALFLSVKDADVSDLTRSDHPFGWLLTVLQKEKATKEELRAALTRALEEINTRIVGLGSEEAGQWGLVITYLYFLIFHRRDPEEHEEFRALVEDWIQVSPFKEEGETVARTMAEHVFEQGIAQGVQQGIEQGIQQMRESLVEGILENLEIRFEGSDLQTIASQLTPIQDIDRLKQLRREVVQTPSVAAFQDIIASNGTD